MQQPTAHVPKPQLAVDETGTVRSLAYDDVYFSARGGVAETEHVFLAGNGLPAQWMDKECFTIGELGFGTGLNFLVAWKQFVETIDLRGHLHFVSVEKFPLTLEQLSHIYNLPLEGGGGHEVTGGGAALQHNPGAAPPPQSSPLQEEEYARQLLEQYPLRLPGWHRVQFDRVTLTLGFGEAADLLGEMDASIDAWFLDGFAPAKNADMWGEEIFQNIARLSASGASFATFTAAGGVKRGLEAVGFTVEKVAGFGSKRDMLRGQFTPPPIGGRLGGGLGQDQRILNPHPNPPPVGEGITVIGGGIAGCTVARALAERGVKVTLLEKEAIAAGASGNAVAVLYPQLTKYYTPATQFHFTGYGFMLQQLKRWGVAHAQIGMVKIGKDNEDEVRLRTIRDSLLLDASIARWVEPDEASQLVGQQLARGGFYFPHGTWIDPATLCRALVAHENISVREHAEVTELPEGIAIIANGYAANELLSKQLTLGRSAGQVSVLEPTLKLNTILCHKGYTIALPGALVTGATYDRDDLSSAVTEKNHQQNIAELRQAVPSLGEIKIKGGRTSIRTTTPSRLPYVGKVEKDVYVSVGHGSRGMISAPLAAEIIASQICGEPLPVSRSLLRAVTPG